MKTDNIRTYFDSMDTKFSFRPLLKFWEKSAINNDVISKSYEHLKEKLKLHPELTEPITDFTLIDKHKGLIRELLSICLPPGISHEAYAAVLPDRLLSFYETPAFSSLGFFENQWKSECFNQNCCLTSEGREISKFAHLLGFVYGLNVRYEYPLIYSTIDGKTGLEKHYRIKIYGWFTELKKKSDTNELSEEEKKFVFENLDNPRMLEKIIPNENFALEGFFIFNATEITDHETISSLKFDLIGKESLMSMDKFHSLENKLRGLLGKRDISLGLIAFPSFKRDIENAMRMGKSIILQEEFVKKGIFAECRIYKDVIESNEVKLIYDAMGYGCSEKVEEAFLSANIRNLLIAPLIYKGELIGLMELASPHPGDLNKINSLKLKEVYPLFAVCIESCLDDLNKSIQSVIKEKCTAIHPSVEWRFRDAAFNYLEKLRNDIVDEMEEIVFDNVHPFFGCSDIKDSSIIRNEAIKSDLIENLELAQKIVDKASEEATIPILEELGFRISGKLDLLKSGLNSSSEIETINFIKNEIGSTFDLLKDISPDLNKTISEYRQKLHPGLGFLFHKRKDFEESLSLVNETICTEIDIQQDKAQRIFPHYFEKYKTDGVEYNMYAGSSMAAEKIFNQMHFKSLRLWQLVTMCIIAKKCNELVGSMSMPLRTTHLIYAASAPITIRFLYDEKKFDVAGSYDIRHEIIKKRIDKAEIKGTKDRLVAPGKIAIVYSSESEAEEYRQYFNFLKTKNYITGEIESFDLEGMQGIQGLKALRIEVNNNLVADSKSSEPEINQKIHKS